MVEPGARIGEQGPPPDRQYLLHLQPLDHLDHLDQADQLDQVDHIEEHDLVLQRKFSEKDKKRVNPGKVESLLFTGCRMSRPDVSSVTSTT